MPDGGIGIGAVVGGWITSTFTGGLATTIAGAVAGAIDTAIVGAVVGGLTSAVTGGDIMSGVLVGAIGGAVTGGVMGAFNPASFGVGAAESTTGELVTSLSGDVVTRGADGLTHVTPGVTKQAVGSAAEEAVTSGTRGLSMGNVLEKGIGEMVGTGVSEGAKAMLASSDAESQRDWQAEQAALDRAAQKEMLQMKLDSAAATSGSAGSQQLASTLAQIASNEKIQAAAWKREDTARARMTAAAKSLFRADEAIKKPNLTPAEIEVLKTDASTDEYTGVLDPNVAIG